MKTPSVLHILKSEPDETVAGLIEALSEEQGVAVVNQSAPEDDEEEDAEI